MTTCCQPGLVILEATTCREDRWLQQLTPPPPACEHLPIFERDHLQSASDLSCSLFARLEDRIRAEPVPKEKSELRKLLRKLRPVHEEVLGHGQLLEAFQDAPEADWEAMVVSLRPDLTSDFFVYMETLIGANHDDRPKADGAFLLLPQRFLALQGQARRLLSNDAGLNIT